MVTHQTNDSLNFIILILIVIQLKYLDYFKLIAEWNNILLIKFLYMIIIILSFIVIFHCGEM